MAARVCSYLNQKGGVGKTTLVLNSGAALADAGHRVLIVDADPQAGLSNVLLGPNETARLDPEQTVAGLFAARRRPRGSSIVQPTKIEGVSIWPGSALLGDSNEARPWERSPDEQRRLVVAVRDVAADFDYVLIDCTPTLALVSWAALIASDGVVQPTLPEDLSLHGIATLAEMVRAIQGDANPRLAHLGYVVTMFDARVTVHRGYLEMLRERYGRELFDAVIPSSSALRTALMRSKPIIETNPRLRVAAAFRSFAAELVDRMDAAAGRPRTLEVA